MEPYKHTLPLNSNNPFSFDRLYAHPGNLAQFDQPGPRKNICIIGGGIAGLAAAYELMQRNHHVAILEASDRCGGRIRTQRFSDGSYGELGAMRIPANHHCTLHYVKLFDLPLRPFVNFNLQAFYYIRGLKTRISDWSNLMALFGLQELEQCDPRLLLEKQMVQAMTSLSSAEKWAMFISHLPQGILRAYDEQSLWQYFSQRISPEGFEYIGHTTGMLQYERASFLETFIDYYGLFRMDQFEIVGGMDTLSEAFVRRLRRHIRYNARVTRVSIDDDGVLVSFIQNGLQYETHFDYAICATPAPTVCHIIFDPPLPCRKVQALRGVTYASAAKTLLRCANRPWEIYDNIFGGGSFTDLLIQQCWYPSDNSRPASDAVFCAFTGDDGQSNYSHAPRLWRGHSSDVSHSPGVFTAAYMWEGNARRFLALSEEERTEVVLRGVRNLHPQVETALEEIVHIAWDEKPNPGCGAFAYFAPGEHSRYQAAMCEPYPAERPRVFFAGEHLAIAHAWIQGAIQTGLTSAITVLEAPTPLRATAPSQCDLRCVDALPS